MFSVKTGFEELKKKGKKMPLNKKIHRSRNFGGLDATNESKKTPINCGDAQKEIAHCKTQRCR